MNTETGISIKDVKSITPLVVGDGWANSDGSGTIADHDVAWFNRFNCEGVYITSFADRPNTGKQPVGNYVIVDIETFTDVAVFCDWASKKPWKPNHKAMLAKFKEQGANTMFTFENTKEATHYHGGDKKHLWRPHFINNEGLVLVDERDGWSRSVKASMNSRFELSRPAGERKEDHTDDKGHVTLALRYKLDLLSEEATHCYKKWATFYKVVGGKYAMVLIENIEWIYSDCTTNAELDGDEFWKLDANQDKPSHHIELAINAGAINDVISPDEPVIEQWVGDQITCPGEPVFTQEQADAGIIPPVGMRAMFYVEEKDVNAWFPGLVCGEFMGKAVARLDDSEVEGYFDDYSADQCKPIDNRTPEDKAMQNMWDAYRGTDTVGGEYPPVVSDILKDIKAGKIHGVKWSL